MKKGELSSPFLFVVSGMPSERPLESWIYILSDFVKPT